MLFYEVATSEFQLTVTMLRSNMISVTDSDDKNFQGE